jgi:hypothetical protein
MIELPKNRNFDQDQHQWRRNLEVGSGWNLDARHTSFASLHFTIIMANNESSTFSSFGASIGSSMSSMLQSFASFGLGNNLSAMRPETAPITLKPSSSAAQSDITFYPWTKNDVLAIYRELCQKLPAELASKVVEAADLWEARSSFVTSGQNNTQHELGHCPRFVQNNSVPILYSNEIDGSLLNPLRRIIVKTISQDQGWSSYHQQWGTHENSWTWFDITLERLQLEAGEAEWREIVRQKLWCNVHASREMVTHVGSLERGEEIVDKAMKGDRLVVWACARFPGWRCETEKVDLWVFSAVH